MELVGHRVADGLALVPSPGPASPAVQQATRGEASAGVPRSTSGAVRDDLEAVFRREYGLVVGVAARVLGSVDQADDVAQEAFLSFSRSSVPASEARGWLCVAAGHLALNLLRTGRRRAAREETVAGAVVDPADPADAVVAREEQARVRAALAGLPRTQAIALVLRHSGLSYAEVAAVLGLAPGSVGTTLRRAERALRKEVDRRAPSE